MNSETIRRIVHAEIVKDISFHNPDGTKLRVQAGSKMR